MINGTRLPSASIRRLKMDEGTQIFDMILSSLSTQASSPREIMLLWLSIGRKLGVEDVIPNFKVISAERNEEGDQDIIGMVGATSEDALDFLVSGVVWTESIVEDCLAEVKDIVIH